MEDTFYFIKEIDMVLYICINEAFTNIKWVLFSSERDIDIRGPFKHFSAQPCSEQFTEHLNC